MKSRLQTCTTANSVLRMLSKTRSAKKSCFARISAASLGGARTVILPSRSCSGSAPDVARYLMPAEAKYTANTPVTSRPVFPWGSKLMRQYECDQSYIIALSIFKRLHQKGAITDEEFVRIDAILAEKFSASEVAKTLKLA